MTDHSADDTETDSEPTEHADGTDSDALPLSRRGALGVLASLGLLGTASQSASAAATTLEFGGKYTSDPGSNYGLWLDPDNARFGLLAFSAASNGRGVVGRATASSGQTIGVIGRSDSSSDGAAGLQGFNNASSGRTFGFKGRSDSTDGRGALGIATADSGNTIGLEGRADSPDGVAVSGTNTADTGTTVGVRGQVFSPAGYGLATPDDAKIEGVLDTNETDFTVEAGTQSTDDAQNVVHGHASNSVRDGAVGGTIGGGGSDDGEFVRPNEVYDNYGTIGGGRNNQAGTDDGDPTIAPNATVSGGELNKAKASGATVGGGGRNEALDSNATVAGGGGNEASGFAATVAGGGGNEARGDNATIPGGGQNIASGAGSFAAGREAKARHAGAFVWSSSKFGTFSSTAASQFLVEARGGVGLGTDSPVSQLHVAEAVRETGATNLGRHVAAIENTRAEDGADVLGLKCSVSDPSEFTNFISFLDADSQVGQIEGNGSGGVSYLSASSDLAEYFPTADPDREYEAGDVVGLADGELVASPTAAQVALVVSDAPMVGGNAPTDGDDSGLACVALLGQVPVHVDASVSGGDLLVATADGTAVPAADRDGTPPVVGRALEGGDAGDLVETFVAAGPERAAPATGVRREERTARDEHGTAFEAATESIAALEAANGELRDDVAALEAENEQLRERLAAVEDRLAGLEPSDPSPASADD